MTELRPSLDLAANRRMKKWSARELAGRALWETLRAPLFAWTPRPLWSWRRMLLRLFGARIGADVQIHPSVKIAVPWHVSIDSESSVGDGAILYSLGRITIGRRATISQYAHLCAGTHDYTRSDLPLLKLPITIGDEAWICAEAFIGPNVNVGRLAIVGARAVALKDVPENTIVAGNPARVLRPRPPVVAPKK